MAMHANMMLVIASPTCNCFTPSELTAWLATPATSQKTLEASNVPSSGLSSRSIARVSGGTVAADGVNRKSGTAAGTRRTKNDVTVPTMAMPTQTNEPIQSR